VKKIRDESGAWIPATYKSKRYAQWKERTKIAENFTGDDDDDDDDGGGGDEDHDDDKNRKRSQLCGRFNLYHTAVYIPGLCYGWSAVHLSAHCRTVFLFLDQKVIHLM
jgi:hypothetical protein